MRNKAWTTEENTALAALYFTMLDSAVAGLPYNKAALIRISQGGDPDGSIRTDCAAFSNKLRQRSRGSIESKLMNASACHAVIAPNDTTMDGFGYRALNNYQSSLLDAIKEERTRFATLVSQCLMDYAS